MADNYAEAASPKPVTAFDEANKAAARLTSPRPSCTPVRCCRGAAVPERLVHLADEPVAVQRHGRVQCSPVAEDNVPHVPWPLEAGVDVRRERMDLRRHGGLAVLRHFSESMAARRPSWATVFMIVGGVVQASVSNIWIFALGRLIAGISSGTATATIGGYINELSPPHMRQHARPRPADLHDHGILVPAICFFFANTSSGWRYLAAFPVVLAVVYLLLAPTLCIESPAWLLNQDARRRPSRSSLVCTARSTCRRLCRGSSFRVSTPCSTTPAASSRRWYLGLARGHADHRLHQHLPRLLHWCAGQPLRRSQHDLWGLSGMVVMSIGMTVAFIVDVSALSIVFTALYVIVFGVTLGPLVWVMTADIFPDSIRASASSLCIGINGCATSSWCVIPVYFGRSGRLRYVPFVVLLAIFYLLALKLVPETSGKSAEEIQAEYDSRREQ
ncbi:Major facilitator superfamily domain [Phytophthora cactorum]|nr:Major facilitator superfamily domain [Phytophthora cactorum]